MSVKTARRFEESEHWALSLPPDHKERAFAELLWYEALGVELPPPKASRRRAILVSVVYSRWLGETVISPEALASETRIRLATVKADVAWLEANGYLEKGIVVEQAS